MALVRLYNRSRADETPQHSLLKRRRALRRVPRILCRAEPGLPAPWSATLDRHRTSSSNTWAPDWGLLQFLGTRSSPKGILTDHSSYSRPLWRHSTRWDNRRTAAIAATISSTDPSTRKKRRTALLYRAPLTKTRPCPGCGSSLAGERQDARFCASSCRREHRRLSRLLSRESDSGYRNLAEYDRRARRRASGV